MICSYCSYQIKYNDNITYLGSDSHEWITLETNAYFYIIFEQVNAEEFVLCDACFNSLQYSPPPLLSCSFCNSPNPTSYIMLGKIKPICLPQIFSLFIIYNKINRPHLSCSLICNDCATIKDIIE